jgi:hypothetical protein
MTRGASFRLGCGLLVAALWLPVVLYFTSGPYAKFGFFITAFYTVPLTLFVAAPLVYLLRYCLSLALCLASGLAIGVAGTLMVLATTNRLFAWNASLVLMLCGLVSSLIFWVVGVWRNGGLTIVGGGREA